MKAKLHLPACARMAITLYVIVDGFAAAARPQEIS
jgi:hypothetical protein